MKYGVSITDACINWDSTEALLRHAHEELVPFLENRLKSGPSHTPQMQAQARLKNLQLQFKILLTVFRRDLLDFNLHLF